MMPVNKKSRPSRLIRISTVALAVGAALALGACSKKGADASQVAAKVNGDEITVHQINFIMQQQRGMRADQSAVMEHRILEQLIDEQLAVQNAEKLKLDRNPDVVQRMEAAKRQILARAYIESVAEKASKPSDDEIHKYFDAHPGLFANRKVYNLQRIEVQAPADKRDDVIAHAQNAKTGAEVTDWLKAQDIKFTANPMTQPAEGLPLPIVDKIATLSDGQSLALPQQFGVSILTIVSTQVQPKTFEQARGPIEQFLSVDLRRSAVQGATKTLREGAKIEYVGQFAASAPAPSEPTSSPAVAPVPAAASVAATTAAASTAQKGQ